jgi:cytochrome oxidase Cu insertion factor (SCO1/SenC/PrrC family)
MKARTILNIGVTATFLIVVVTVMMIAVRGGAKTKSLSKLPVLGSVPDFNLVEANGELLALSNLTEKVWIASFIFTRCATACPKMMRAEVKLQSALPVRNDLKLVTFSVDPDFDTPEKLTQYAEMFGADRGRWLFLTGDRKRIFQIAIEGFRLGVAEADPDDEMPILHSTKFVLVDRRGLIRGYFDSEDEQQMDALKLAVRKVLAEKS